RKMGVDWFVAKGNPDVSASSSASPTNREGPGMTYDFTALRERHPEWMIRPTAAGALLMATRRDRYHLSADELGAGLAMTLIEETPEALAEALAAQSRIGAGAC